MQTRSCGRTPISRQERRVRVRRKPQLVVRVRALRALGVLPQQRDLAAVPGVADAVRAVRADVDGLAVAPAELRLGLRPVERHATFLPGADVARDRQRRVVLCIAFTLLQRAFEDDDAGVARPPGVARSAPPRALWLAHRGPPGSTAAGTRNPPGRSGVWSCRRSHPEEDPWTHTPCTSSGPSITRWPWTYARRQTSGTASPPRCASSSPCRTWCW
jgi:hypothetical protein